VRAAVDGIEAGSYLDSEEEEEEEWECV
jgi:hypothetical protein